jgi:general secretion pathway protein K
VCGSLPSLNSLRSNRANSRQRGVILIAVLLTVALVAGLGIKFAGQYQLGLARAESRWHGLQARAFLEGTEEVAKLLFSTADLDEKIDYLGEPWANEVPIEEEGVTGIAKLVDATTQLNLNDLDGVLPADKPIGTPDRYTEPQRRFIRLLQTFYDVPLGQQEAEALLESVVDWIDQDDGESGMGGAESNYYQGLADPYMAANAPFRSVDELRLIRGFNENPLLVNRLLPYVTVLPGNTVGININTLEAVIIQEGVEVEPGDQGANQANNLVRALGSADSLEPMTDSDAIQLLMDRPETGFADAAAVTEAWSKMFSGRQLDTTGINSKTNFFWLHASVQMVDQRRNMRSLMERGEQSTLRVRQREDVYELPTVARPDEDDEKDDK